MECTNRLRQLREGRKLKRHELAVELGVDPATVYRWETGKGEIPDAQKFKLAEFFEVTPSFLMGWPEGAAA